jgi:hypothetical protein
MTDERKTITLRKEQFFVKLFHTVWGTYPDDTCKLAWGIIFLPLGVFLGAIFGAAEWIGDAIRAKFPAKPRQELTWQEIDDLNRAKRAKQMNKRDRRKERLAWLINVGNKIVGFFQVIGDFFARIGKFSVAIPSLSASPYSR